MVNLISLKQRTEKLNIDNQGCEKLAFLGSFFFPIQSLDFPINCRLYFENCDIIGRKKGEFQYYHKFDNTFQIYF